MKHSEQATYFHEFLGYNCSQSVLLAYKDILDVDPVILFKLSEGFGLGSGSMNGICGAVNAGIMIISYLISGGKLDDTNKTKPLTYKYVREYQHRFNEKTKALVCRQLKDPKSDSFTPCKNCIIYACDILDEILTELP